jgi:hypothetical protein
MGSLPVESFTVLKESVNPQEAIASTPNSSSSHNPAKKDSGVFEDLRVLTDRVLLKYRIGSSLQV